MGPPRRISCKNGGWRNYGTTFKNQGDCVSFINHHARQRVRVHSRGHRAAGVRRVRRRSATPHAMRGCVRDEERATRACPRRDTRRAMSQENVELVRKAWDGAWSKPPNWALLNPALPPGPRLRKRLWRKSTTPSTEEATGFQRFLADQDETWDDWRHTLDSLSSTRDGDAVVVESPAADSHREAQCGWCRSSATARCVTVPRGARSSGLGPTSVSGRPSKPWGCRNSRCRRRTWRLCVAAFEAYTPGRHRVGPGPLVDPEVVIEQAARTWRGPSSTATLDCSRHSACGQRNGTTTEHGCSEYGSTPASTWLSLLSKRGRSRKTGIERHAPTSRT